MAYIGEIARRDIGSETGKALHDALSQLADIKMRQMLQRQETSRVQKEVYEPIMEEPLARLLANASPKERPQLMQALPAISNLLKLRQQQGGQNQEDMSGYQQFMQQRGQQNVDQEIPQFGQQQRPMQNVQPQQMQPDDMSNAYQQLSQSYGDPSLALKKQKMQQTQSQFSQKQNIAQAKSLDMSKVIDRTEKYSGLMDQYDRLIENADSGELISGPLSNLLDTQGARDIITNPLTNITEKEAQDIFTNEFIGLELGGRPSEVIFNTIAKGYANLRQYPEAMAVVAGLKKYATMKKKLIDDKQIELFDKYDQSGQVVPSTLRNMATKMVQPQLERLSQETKQFYDKRVFDILIKQKKDMGGGRTGKIYKDINDVSTNLKLGGKVVNKETGEVFVKTKDGLKKASYINGDWKVTGV